ncbi:arsenic resistance N-acetyltransferase ArsN2 [Pseudoxanthomonas beigongshangi]
MLTIHPVNLDDSVVNLLHESGLLTSDLEAGLDVAFLGARTQDTLQGCIALERCQDALLLRSLAVAQPYRGSGLGKALVSRAEEKAKADGFRAVYLLTVGASGFFTSRGYKMLDRSDAPAAIRTTSQFSTLCPASSFLMVKELD